MPNVPGYISVRALVLIDLLRAAIPTRAYRTKSVWLLSCRIIRVQKDVSKTPVSSREISSRKSLKYSASASFEKPGLAEGR